MKFKIDENLPIEAAGVLQAAGPEALTVHDQNLRGEFDQNLRRLCTTEERVLVTFDLDFSDLRTYQGTPGCILLRLHSQDRENVLKVLHKITPVLQGAIIANSIWIVQEDRIRIRQA